MSIINSKVPAFKAQAYHNEAFKTVTNEDLAGKWSIFFFYPADFTFVCPTELGDLADKYAELQKLGPLSPRAPGISVRRTSGSCCVVSAASAPSTVRRVPAHAGAARGVPRDLPARPGAARV